MTEAIVPSHPARILAPLDGSRAADIAAPFAVELARRGRLPVTVLHVFSSVKELTRVACEPISWTDHADPRATIDPPAAIRDSVDLFTGAGIDVEVVGRVGTASDEIIREVEASPDVWLVMSSLGSTGIRRLFLGSTARDVLGRSRQPVLLIPSSHDVEQFAAGGSERQIGVLLDGTPVSERAICEATAAAETLSLGVDLVRVAETYRDEESDRSPDDHRWEQPAVDAIESYLKSMANACGSIRISVDTVVLAGSPDVQIRKYVRERRPAIVALATRKRSGIERWTYGSLAERLVDDLPVPLLLVPSREQ